MRRRLTQHLRRFRRSEDGAAMTIEFLILFPLFIAIPLFTFAGTLLALGFIEVSAENLAIWNSEHVSGYFWSIEPDPTGTEAERLAFDMAGTPLARTDMELCRIVDQN